MSIRTLSLLTLVTVTVTSTGCSGMKNFLFGRGASCGLCNRIGAVGQAVNPFAPAPATTAGGCGTGGCGLFNRGGGVTPPPMIPQQPVYSPVPGYAPMAGHGTCETCPQPYLGDACGGEYSVGMPADPYHGGTVDPYLNGGAVYGGQVYGGEVIGGGIIDGGMYQGDSFGPRSYRSNRFDSQGDEIIQADPLPPGARLVN